MRTLVTGATGHVGANLCRLLVEEGHDVTGLSRRPGPALDDVRVRQVRGDVRRLKDATAAAADAEVVFHLAGRISIDGDPDGRVHEVNVGGTRNVVEACLASGVRRLVHVSSFHAFRQSPVDDELTEERGEVGVDAYPYDRSKAAGDREVLRGVDRGLPAVILNPTAIVGPHDHEPSRMGGVLLDLYHGRLPALVPGGSDWVDVRDVCRAAMAAVDGGASGERYLLAGGWTTLAELARLAATITGRPAPRLTAPMWLARAGVPFVRLAARFRGTPLRYTGESLDKLLTSSRRVSHAKATRDLGFAPRPLEDTLRDAYAWFEAEGRLG